MVPCSVNMYIRGCKVGFSVWGPFRTPPPREGGREGGRGTRKVDIRLPGEGNLNFHGARPVYLNHLDDEVDSDQQVVNKELSLHLSFGGLG